MSKREVMARRVSVRTPKYQEQSSASESEPSVARRVVSKSPKKSKYFKHSESSVAPGSESEASGSEIASDDLQSGREEESGGSANESDSDSEIDGPSTQTRRKRKSGRQVNTQPEGDSSTKKSRTTKTSDKSIPTGEYFVAKLPPLPAGDIAYDPETIHPNSLSFLRDLRENNERDWFQARDLQYQAAKQDFDMFVLSLGNTIRTIDDTIPELPVKDLTFRIYRDIRFSNDRTPYKTFLSVYFSRTGRKGPWAGYYFSLEPTGKTILACGLWQPPPTDLALVRASIDADVESWTTILDDPGFLQFFGKDGIFKTEDKLKTCPKGFNKDHKNIALLRLKSFTVSMTFNDEEVIQEGFQEILAVVIGQMYPLVTLLNSIIRPDPELNSDSDSER